MHARRDQGAFSSFFARDEDTPSTAIQIDFGGDATDIPIAGNLDPTDAGGQFVDRGSQYRPEIFVHDDAQRKAAEASKAALAASGRFE